MKYAFLRYWSVCAFLLLASSMQAQPGEVNYTLLGWASEAGGTTGGAGGVEITATTGQEILDVIKDKKNGVINQPLTIYVDGVITPENTSSDSKIAIKDVNDVTLIGVADRGVFDGIGIKVWKASNVIVRNVTVFKVLAGDKDAISIEGPADHIWIDHCELYAEYQGVDKDYYDGLLDAKSDAEYLTYSWNSFHDSWKTMLIGSSESDFYDRKVTIHHNRFVNCNSRLPLFRGGNAHIFNNYYQDIPSTCINSRIGACIRIENNYFRNVQNPYVTAFSDIFGAGELIGNILDSCTFVYADDTHELPECTAMVPYDYQAGLQPAEDVPLLTLLYTGVNKLDSLPSSTFTSSTLSGLRMVSTVATDFLMIESESGHQDKIQYHILALDGRILQHGYWNDNAVSMLQINTAAFLPGMYCIAFRSGNQIQTFRFIIFAP